MNEAHPRALQQQTEHLSAWRLNRELLRKEDFFGFFWELRPGISVELVGSSYLSMHIRRPIRSPITYSPKDESVSPSPLPARKAYRPEGSALAPRWKLRAGSRAGSLVEAGRPWRLATGADHAYRAGGPGGFRFERL